jgi:hypothetical protein
MRWRFAGLADGVLRRQVDREERAGHIILAVGPGRTSCASEAPLSLRGISGLRRRRTAPWRREEQCPYLDREFSWGSLPLGVIDTAMVSLLPEVDRERKLARGIWRGRRGEVLGTVQVESRARW